MRFLIDSGSAINIINLETFNQIKKKNRNLFLKSAKTKTLTYGAKNVSSLQMKGTCQLTFETGTKITAALFYVIDSNSHKLLTGACAIELDLISLHCTISGKRDKRTKLQEVSVVKEKIVKVNIKQSQSDGSKISKRLQKLITSYRQTLFTGKIEKLKDTKIKLHINDKIPPVAQAKRRIPFVLMEKAQKEIEHLEQQDIIADITSQATPCLSQLVIVPKSDGGVRLCIDMRNFNTATERTRFPTPTVDDLIFKQKGAKYFTKLDLNSAFHQLELHEDSRYITAFQTEDRIKRFKRLIFALNIASEQLQHYL